MRELCIPPAVQVAAVVGIGGAIAAVLAAEAPEIQRYLKIKAM